MRNEPNPPEYEIDAAYDRLKYATLDELSRLIPKWNLWYLASGGCELLVLRSASHPSAVMIAAGRRLAERIGISVDRLTWQALELNA